MNKYVIFFAVNWPDALLDQNGAEHWPLNYDFAGVFQADSLEGLWDLLYKLNKVVHRGIKSYTREKSCTLQTRQ